MIITGRAIPFRLFERHKSINSVSSTLKVSAFEDDLIMSVLEALKVSTLDENSGELVSLADLRSNKSMIIDFWHTKCVKCPAAIDKLNEEAEGEIDSAETVVVCCALSLGEGNKEMVKDVVSDWENITHVFMDMEMKEEAKKLLNFAAVPFYVIVNKDGVITGKGDPKKMDYIALLNKPSSEVEQEASTTVSSSAIEESTTKEAPAATTEAAEYVFTLDEDF